MLNDTVHLDSPKPLMVAHRGVSGLEKENTASAFVAAGNRSYFGIETDIHTTADNQFVLIHDENTKRVAGDEMIVEKTSFNTLRALRLIENDGTRMRGDYMLPTLEEYISICKKYDKKAVLEIKNAFTPANIDRVIAIIRDMGWLENTIFISFNLPNMICIRERLPEQPAQFLISTYPDWLVDTLVKYHLDLDIDYRAMTPERAKELHDKGIKINVWTVNTAEDAKAMMDCGVDFITTNILE